MLQTLLISLACFGIFGLLLGGYKGHPTISRKRKTLGIGAALAFALLGIIYFYGFLMQIPAPTNSVSVPVWKAAMFLAVVVTCLWAWHHAVIRFNIPRKTESTILKGLVIVLLLTALSDYFGGFAGRTAFANESQSSILLSIAVGLAWVVGITIFAFLVALPILKFLGFSISKARPTAPSAPGAPGSNGPVVTS